MLMEIERWQNDDPIGSSKGDSLTALAAGENDDSEGDNI